MSEAAILPVSMGALIKEIRQISEKEPDEYRFFEIHSFLPGMKASTLRRKLKTLQEEGKVSSRKIDGITVWKFIGKSELP